MKTLVGLVCLLLAGASPVVVAGPVVLTFDDLPTPAAHGSTIPGGYGGLQWQNFSYENGSVNNPSGYLNGMVSGPNVAFNGWGTNAVITGSRFDLNSAYVTGAWNDGLKLEVQGFVGSALTYDATYVVDSTAPSLLNFNFLGVTSVKFIPSGGTPHGYFSNTLGDTHFALDNLTITLVPEPSTLALAGLGALGLWRRPRGR